jgi:hypothetical protein
MWSNRISKYAKLKPLFSSHHRLRHLPRNLHPMLLLLLRLSPM